MLERAPFWIGILMFIDSPSNMLQWHCLHILVSMKGRKWQIIKILKTCLNEECLHHWTTCLEQIIKFIFFWLCVLIRSPTRFRMNLHYAVAWMFQGTPYSKQTQYIKMQRTRPHNHLVAMGLSPAVISFSLLKQWCFRTILDNLCIVNFHG